MTGTPVPDGTEMRAFLDLYLKALASGQASVFIGAGLSVPAGYVDWKTLLRPLAEDVGLDVAKEHNLIRVAQYVINTAGGRARVNQRIVTEFSRAATRVPSHDILAQLPISTLLDDELRLARGGSPARGGPAPSRRPRAGAADQPRGRRGRHGVQDARRQEPPGPLRAQHG
jgi:hypothetical protein